MATTGNAGVAFAENGSSKTARQVLASIYMFISITATHTHRLSIFAHSIFEVVINALSLLATVSKELYS